MLRLYKERLSQVDAKLQEVIAGKAPEYLEPLATLQENMQIRTKVAGRKVKHLFHIEYELFRFKRCLSSEHLLLMESQIYLHCGPQCFTVNHCQSAHSYLLNASCFSLLLWDIKKTKQKEGPQVAYNVTVLLRYFHK